ncbi:sialidase family protein [Lentisphaera araneosa]|nr:sialidase family protein [Lentisphaera araneosa]
MNKVEYRSNRLSHMKLLKILSLWMFIGTASYGQSTPVFTSGQEGYKSFRIPAIISTHSDTLLAFCEGRVNGLSDTGNIDMVMKRSDDGGKTWSKLEVLWNDESNVCGNPCPVVLESGEILLLMTWNHGSEHEGHIKSGTSKHGGRVPYVMSSKDNGKTWSKPRDISVMADKDSWGWYATGPGNAIQMQHGKYKGRIVVPCADSDLKNHYDAHAIYSDDDGKTWKYSGQVGAGANESCILELGDGTLVLNSRQQTNKSGSRGQAISKDGGVTWINFTNKTPLKDPTCQAAFISYDHKNTLLFMNPQGRGRSDGIVQLSSDAGKTWKPLLVLPKGFFAYSSMTVMGNGDIALIYEASGYRTIPFTLITADQVKQVLSK